DKLPYFAVPRYIEFRDELPRNATGKILKYQLREEGVTAATWDIEQSSVGVSKRGPAGRRRGRLRWQEHTECPNSTCCKPGGSRVVLVPPTWRPRRDCPRPTAAPNSPGSPRRDSSRASPCCGSPPPGASGSTRCWPRSAPAPTVPRS